MFSSVRVVALNQNFPVGISALFSLGQRWTSSTNRQLESLLALPVASHLCITRHHVNSFSFMDFGFENIFSTKQTNLLKSNKFLFKDVTTNHSL